MKQETRNLLCSKAIEAAPNEACGFILEDETIVECENISETPKTSFRMSGCDVLNKLEQHGLSRISGIWHTHPRGTTYPSATDIRSVLVGAIDESWKYYIVTKDEVTECNMESYFPRNDELFC